MVFNKKQFKKQQLVWVPKIALALWSKPGTKFTESLWSTGIIIDIDTDGNVKVLVNGKLEISHTNFIREMV